MRSRISTLGSFALLVTACTSAPTRESAGPLCDAQGVPRYLETPHVFAQGIGVTNTDCRGGALCKHNENTDLYRFGGATFLVHRTAESQILGPNSALLVYRSVDEGATFTPLSVIPAVADRDIRDPAFYSVGKTLFLKAITRVRGFTERDGDVHTVTVTFRSDDQGATWSEVGPIGPEGFGFWRVLERDGTLHSAAYQDGDLQVVLFSSTDGEHWTQGAQIYGTAADTPLETELVSTPGGRMLALIRMDGTDAELLGNTGRLRTKVCRAAPPFAAFDCSQEIVGQRLDGATHFWDDGRLFVVARAHLQPSLRKRTTLFELIGNFEEGPLAALEWGHLPSAGDTAYAGTVKLANGKHLVSWYSGDVAKDPPWTASMLSGTDIWLATFDPKKLPSAPPTEAQCVDPRKDEPVRTEFDCSVVVPDPKAVCGQPCDVGNGYGVGEYCTTEGGQCADNARATTCSDALNGSLIVTSYMCTLVCDATTDCGPGASCRCPILQTGGQICGCIPDSCQMPPGAEGKLP